MVDLELEILQHLSECGQMEISILQAWLEVVSDNFMWLMHMESDQQPLTFKEQPDILSYVIHPRSSL